MSTPFKKRVFGCTIVKSINSNYNADFTHQPRTLPDGTVYATDKALKYTVRNYLKQAHAADKVFFFKVMNSDMQPQTLDETYEKYFGAFPTKKGKDAAVDLRKAVAKNMLSCIDVRLFRLHMVLIGMKRMLFIPNKSCLLSEILEIKVQILHKVL